MINISKRFYESTKLFLRLEVSNLTDESTFQLPSEFVEENRYLPQSVTKMSGFYSFDNSPYWREILDTLDPRDPTTHIAVMKGVQTGGTVGFIENGIFYVIAKIKNAPAMFFTADDSLAKIRIENYILPMIHQSGYTDSIQSNDQTTTKKQGATAKRISWKGGGFLIPASAKSLGMMKSISGRYIFRDEVGSWDRELKGQGSPIKLTEERSSAYEKNRKVVDVSTPTTKGACFISENYELGDKRHYYVPCLECGELQSLRFNGINKENGIVYGLIYKLDDDGNLISGSVRYSCKYCGHQHINEDKFKMFADKKMGGSAEWRPTAKPISPLYKSYHLPALYAPSFAMSWETCILRYLQAWDVKNNRIKNFENYKTFYNSVLGEPFEIQGDKVRFSMVSNHRRSYYESGVIPNISADTYSGGKIGFVSCTVDVHDKHLEVATWGTCPGGRIYLIERLSFEGDCKDYNDEPSWGRLKDLILTKTYYSDDGERAYRIAITLIDSSYNTNNKHASNNENTVYRFCKKFNGMVYPIKGRAESVKKNAVQKEFARTALADGSPLFYVNVNNYKEIWHDALNKQWDKNNGEQPEMFFNAPRDITDDQLKELTKEEKKVHEGQVKWHRPGGSKNELWDLLIYANAAVDILAFYTCFDMLKLPKTNWEQFWQIIDVKKIYYIDRK